MCIITYIGAVVGNISHSGKQASYQCINCIQTLFRIVVLISLQPSMVKDLSSRRSEVLVKVMRIFVMFTQRLSAKLRATAAKLQSPVVMDHPHFAA